MAKKPDIQAIPVAPLTGPLDLRSEPALIPPGALRGRQNWQTTGQGKLARSQGWQKFQSEANYNNNDFHDQLLLFNPGGDTPIRQPITLLFESESTRKVRSLFLATQSKIAKLNEYSGNWKILGSGYGGVASASASAPRFHAAQVGDYVGFTNNLDKPMYHTIEAGTEDGTIPNLQIFDDLELIGCTQAAVIWSWHNVLFLADVVMDGERYAYRILWSDVDNPTSFDPASLDSITGSKDLFFHERILAARPLGNSFLIYTTHGIWQMTIVGGEKSFDFTRLFDGEDNPGASVLRYPNTLVGLPDAHIYCATDGVYLFSPYYGKPERLEWLHVSTPAIFDNIDDSNCTSHVATYAANEVLIFTASLNAANQCPDRGLRINMNYRTADTLDYGVTALSSYRPFKSPTVRDFIITEGLCDIDTLTSLGYGWTNEGLPRVIPVPPATLPIRFYTTTDQVIDGITVEDWNLPTADVEISLCFLLGDARISDICPTCETVTLIVAANSADWCLKQLGGVFYREMCLNPTAVGSQDVGGAGYFSSVGSYSLDGITSILRFPPMFASQAGDPMLQMDQVRVDGIPVAQDPPSSVVLRVGISAAPADPNVDVARIVWHQHSAQPLKVLSARTGAQHLAAGTMPSEFAHWHLYRKGRVLYVELTISGTGGACEFSKVAAEVKLAGTVAY